MNGGALMGTIFVGALVGAFAGVTRSIFVHEKQDKEIPCKNGGVGSCPWTALLAIVGAAIGAIMAPIVL